MPLERPEDLDALWEVFLKSGDVSPVRTIATVLERPDRTKEALEAWHAKPPRFWSAKKKARIAARLESVGLDPARTVDLDLVLWHLMTGGFQAPVELPYTMTDDYVLHLMMKGSACWSLQSNANQHAAVAEIVTALPAMKTAPRFA